MTSPTSATSAPTANPSRQPHDESWASLRVAASTAAQPEARSWPTVVETYWNEEKRPRRPDGADSTRNVVFAANSPPIESPEINRPRTKITGAHRPTAAYDGVTASTRLPNPIARMVRVSVFLRPQRSASEPISSPPSGRSTNPTAKTANELSTAETSSPPNTTRAKTGVRNV